MELIKKINKLIHDKNIVIIFFLFLAVHILSTLVFYCMSKDVAIAQNPLEKKTEFERVLIHKLFKKSVLLAMKTYYTTLISGNPSVHLVNAKGWDTRIEDLEHK